MPKHPVRFGARTGQEGAARWREAAPFFVAAIPQMKDASVRKLFEELRERESEYETLVRREVENAPPDPKIAVKEFADEPVGE
jgi:rubrerythrin